MSSSKARNLLYPPLNFAYVETGVYRSAVPNETHYPFLQSLQLRTIVLLSEPAPLSLTSYLQKHGDTRILQIENAISPVAEDMVVRCLEVIADWSNHPILISCRHGKYLSGVVLACMRKLQRWNLISCLEEYRRFSGFRQQPQLQQQQHEQFIELFDTDLIDASRDTAPDFLRASSSSSSVPSTSSSLPSLSSSTSSSTALPSPAAESHVPLDAPTREKTVGLQAGHIQREDSFIEGAVERD